MQGSCNGKLSDDGLSLRHRYVFGKNVERIRRNQGIGKAFFCLMADISRPTLDKIESGSADPKLSTMTRISEALATDLTSMLQMGDSMSRREQ